ncbi:hypothetical protein [Aestuariivita sp.]|uniref:hypothetical protein n=1 Tax=Aestuariivita sp. TaxID=1872407 RepID=UPI0021704C1D|nr:hypothetical protein [Aestuariivita sp.]MCE8005981.1 hypothetical protein [Aestuariivita sp.]
MIKNFVSAFVIFSLFITPIYPTQVSAQSLESCTSDSEDVLFTALQQRARDGYREAHETFDYRIAVRNAWRQVGMTGRIASSAQSAGDDYRPGGLLPRRLTGWSEERAREAANTIADQTFSNTRVESGFEEVVNLAVEDLLDFFEVRSQDISETLGVCFSDFLNVNYPPIIQGAVGAHMEEIDVSVPTSTGEAGQTGVPVAAITGALLVVIATVRRQVVRRIAGRIAGRIGGKIAARAIPGLGWALLGYEVLFEGNGAIPEIVENMSSSEIVANLQDEISSEIEQEISQQLDNISADVARGSMESWRSFVQANQLVLTLREANPLFSGYLDQFTNEDDLLPIRDAIAIIVELEGEEGLNDILNGNQMADVVALTDSARAIARATDSVSTAISWQRKAGTDISAVAQHRLYQFKQPDDLTQDQLSYILSLNEGSLIRKAALLSPDDLQSLRIIDDLSTRKILATVNEEDLPDTINYLRQITDQSARNTVAAYVNGSNYRPATLNDALQDISISRNQELASELLLSTTFFGLLDPQFAYQTFNGVTSGEISWQVAMARYNLPSAVLIGLLVLLALLVIRPFGLFRRRQEVIIRHEKSND